MLSLTLCNVLDRGNLRNLQIVQHISKNTRRHIDTIAILVQDFEQHLQDARTEGR